jgi:hypothetical protein
VKGRRAGRKAGAPGRATPAKAGGLWHAGKEKPSPDAATAERGDISARPVVTHRDGRTGTAAGAETRRANTQSYNAITLPPCAT